MTPSLTFSQSFFEQNISVQRKLLRFSAIMRLEIPVRGECVLIWGGFTLSGKGGSHGVYEEGVHRGVHKKGGSREPCEPPGYGPG